MNAKFLRRQNKKRPQRPNFVVLIVEDDLDSANLYAAVAKKIGCEVLIAENGHVALEIIKSRDQIDIILLDLEMPVMNGLRFYIEYVGLGLHPTAKVILTSSHTLAPDLAEALQLYAHLPKNTHIDELGKLLEKALA